MANTYTQIHLHFVFAVKFRDGLIQASWKHELYKYITGIVQNHGHKLIAINGTSDHIHLLIGLRPDQSVSSLMKEVKGSSSKWINQKKYLPVEFAWQEGYGAFSHSRSQVPEVIKYIENQEGHHKKRTFREEYLHFLKKFEIDYDERYVFKDLTDQSL